nr:MULTISPECIES: DUF6883 domain-containing protein [unclassified Desertifilum]
MLIQRSRNDKSQFLAKAGFTAENSEDLLNALRQLTDLNEALEDRTDEYGTYYQVKGSLQGINGLNLEVIAIWLQRKIDGQFQFITLIPNKEADS